MHTYADVLDAVARIVYAYGANKGVSASRDQIRSAVVAAYKSLPTIHQWRRYRAIHRINLQTAVPVVVNYNASNLTLTLASGTWPVWVRDCSVRIMNVLCRIAERVDDTTVVLQSPPGIGSSNNIACMVYNDAHELPGDYLNIISVIGVVPRYVLQPLQSETQFYAKFGHVTSGGVPQYYHVQGGSRNILRLYPPPSSARVLDVFYSRTVPDLIHTGRDSVNTQGTINASGKNVTGTGTSFRPDMVGRVIRIGDGSSVPTDYEGLNPYFEERLISVVNSETSLTVSEPFTNSYVGATYCISDLLDVDDYQYQLLVCLAVERVARMGGYDIPLDTEIKMKEAKAADNFQAGVTEIGQTSRVLFSGRIVS